MPHATEAMFAGSAPFPDASCVDLENLSYKHGVRSANLQVCKSACRGDSEVELSLSPPATLENRPSLAARPSSGTHQMHPTGPSHRPYKPFVGRSECRDVLLILI